MLNIENAFRQKDIIVRDDITRAVIKILIFLNRSRPEWDAEMSKRL